MPEGFNKDSGPPRDGNWDGGQGDPLGAGPGGVCRCLICGYEVPHVAGQPCNQQVCPKCKTTLTRVHPDAERR